MGEVELTSIQIKAAQLLMSKLIPDLARTELTGADGGAINITTDDDKAVIAMFAAKAKEK
ncbi:hypothetical protein UFOVP826_68 [uncultured Caudovirales phage]|uniref:Uncharacterized protein n=1 Tax=uncultured Caudovirales phage TaxID=2100421 RepID=A0A6J5P5J3_9CAUD|nr:hypothetical protein UFOVP826_68 [uncultured Caudovirales phage]